jgi:DNA-binding transcriptional ArsR family regulator
LTTIGFSPYTARMDEKRYRESRLCRLMGNPIVYQLISLLDVGGPMTPSKLAKLIGRHVSTISIHLAKLRSADVVRYDTSGKETRYWLKHKSEMRGLLKMLERVVDASAKLE